MCINLELRTRGPCGAALARSRTARQIDLSGRIVVFENLKNTGQPGLQALASRLVKRVEAKIFPVRRAGVTAVLEWAYASSSSSSSFSSALSAELKSKKLTATCVAITTTVTIAAAARITATTT